MQRCKHGGACLLVSVVGDVGGAHQPGQLRLVALEPPPDPHRRGRRRLHRHIIIALQPGVALASRPALCLWSSCCQHLSVDILQPLVQELHLPLNYIF